MRTTAVLALLALFGAAYAQDAPKPGLKPYAEVVTKDAVSQSGMFKVHRIDDKLLFEIPPAMLGRELLWQTEIAETPTNTGYSGSAAGLRIIRFTRRGNRIFLRAVDHSVRAEGDEGTRLGVQLSTVEPILMAFDILTENGDKAAVIDVTALFSADPPDFSAKAALNAGGVDPSRSYIDRVKAFPNNIETVSFLTFVGGGGPPSPFGAAPGPSSESASVHYSLALLPEQPMQGRLKDSRIGYFTTDYDVYGRPDNRVVHTGFINRFRLEKKDPNAAVSEPVKPITFYISREVPVKWRQYLKQGIEDWNVAFEGAGFKHAVVCLEAPTREEDPDWDPEDARYSVIRWAPSPVANAMGPSIQDPRSGETLSAHVIIWNNVVSLAENWYFAQAGVLDPRAHHLPMPDTLMGELLRYIVCHEVGHTLGLEHNFKASSAVTIAQLRDPVFTKEQGLSASIMDYSRFNYVAQPGDGVTRTIGGLGPYDMFAIQYGYAPIPGAKTPLDEKPALDRLLAKQVTDKRLRFGNSRPEDPTVETEDLGDDPVEATRLGLLNIDRIAKNILWNAATKFGDDYSKLAEMRSELISQRMTELSHVMRVPGGVVETDYHAGRGGNVFKPVPGEQQARAVRFLVTEGFRRPEALYTPQLVGKLDSGGWNDEATSAPLLIVNALLSESKMTRLAENTAPDAYTIPHLVADLTGAVYPPLSSKGSSIDLYHRTIQREYLRIVDRRINGASATRTDLKPTMKRELRRLAGQIDKDILLADNASALHLKECRSDIEKILNGKYSSSGGGGGFSLMDLFGLRGDSLKDRSCWSEWSRIPKEFLPDAR